VLVTAVWVAAFHAVLERRVGQWLPIVLAPLLLGVAFLAIWGLSRRRAADDPLSQWRGFRAVKRAAFVTDAPHASRLELDLVAESDLAGPAVRLVFDGVAGLAMSQLEAGAIHFDYLVCTTCKFGPKRFRVHDRWDEAIRFWCDSFVALPVGSSQAKA